MGIANLKRWGVRILANGLECDGSMCVIPNGEYVKFEDVVELLKQTNNMPSVPCDRKECPAWDCGVCSSYLGSSCKVNGTAHVG